MKMEFSVYLIFSCVVLSVIVHVFGCDDSKCLTSNGTVCNEQGICECGVCKCQGPYSGPTCEDCPACLCDRFKDCVGCKIFGTGTLSAVECIIQCDHIFIPVDKSEFDNPADDNDKILCNNIVRVNDIYCMESFRIGGMQGDLQELSVRTEQDCSAKYSPTDPPVIEVTMGTTKNVETGPKQKPEDAAAVSGSNQGRRVGDNGAEQKTVSSMLVLILTFLSLALSL